MPIISAWRSLTPLVSCSAPAAKSPLAAPLKKRNVGPRLELRILLQQLLVAALQRAEVLLLLFRELLEDPPAARVARDARGARVELEAASLRGNRDAQRVAREQQLRRPLVRRLAGRPVRQASQVP